MFGLDPRLAALIALLFIGLGIFNLYLGRKRMREVQERGQQVVWYKHISILTGIEYILLALVLGLRLGVSANWFSASLSNIAVPLYTFLLLLSAVVLGLMLYQAFKGSRAGRVRPATVQQASTTEELDEQDMTPEQRAEYTKKRRERRQKAAAARRRRTGRA